MLGLFYPYGIILQALAIVHFVRRRPDTFWLWIILIGGGLGALVYIAAEVIPDATLLRGAYEVFPRRKRIKHLQAAILDNPAIGNYEELGDLYLEDKQYARARECFDRVIAARTDSTDAYYRRALAALATEDTKAAVADLEEVFARDPKYDYQRAAGLLAHTWATLGEHDKAEALFAEVTRTSTLSETQYNYASLLAARGRTKEAREWAQRILAKKPTMPNYLRRRERVWFRKAGALLKRLPAACVLLAAALAGACAGPASARQPAVDNVLLVTMDGLRWQELFGGLSAELLTPEAGGVSKTMAAAIASRFGAATAEARRETLMPFFWTVVAREGQVFGDASRGSDARVTNGLRFSYPGYNELLAGFADPRVDSNDPVANPNVTVLEWLNRRPRFAGRVAAFASWELLPWILNQERSGIPSNGDGAPIANPATDRERAINEFADDLPPYWGATRHDAPTGFGALEYLRRHRPRVLYVMLGETDEWAHGRRYDLYLDAAWRNDRFVRRLWEAAQSMPEYANRTALVLTTDHGRGETAADWTSHGRDVPAAERIWMAVMGPGVPALGVRANVKATQAQIAATVAALAGEDYRAAQPKAAPPLDLQR